MEDARQNPQFGTEPLTWINVRVSWLVHLPLLRALHHQRLVWLILCKYNELLAWLSVATLMR